MSVVKDDIAREENLDTVDPLRHLMSLSVTSDMDSNPILPAQISSVSNQTIHLSFPTPKETQDFRDIRITLAVDASPGCGGIVWPAGQVLAKYLTRRGDQSFRGKNIIELGSGTGLVGIVAACLGGNVWITDQAPLLETMRRNVLMNSLASSITVLELNWGEALPDSVPHPDLVLAADCVYFEPAFPLLVQTLSDLTNNGQTEILFCYKKRRKADKRFFSLLKKSFNWAEITDDPDRETYSREAVSLLRLTKRSNVRIMVAEA